MGLLSDNPMQEAFGQRALLWATKGGADFGECLSTVARVGSGGNDEWYREWMSTGDRLVGIGETSEAGGHRASAREAYFRAASYYHVSYMPLFGKPVDPRLVAAFDKETDAFRRAADLSSPKVQALEIPFEGGTLPAYLATPDDSGAPRPTILQTNGYDSDVHEMYFSHAPAAVARGYNWLGFDGPGQGRTLVRDNIPMRPNWETVVTPVIDEVSRRPEVDPDRIVLVGWSFGGFLAPRAASFEHRLAALVADPGQWDMGKALVSMMPLSDADKARFPDVDPSCLDPMVEYLQSDTTDPMLRWRLIQRALWVHGVDSFFDYVAAAVEYELSSVVAGISCPTMLTAAEGDPTAAGAELLYEALQVPKVLVRFSEAEGAGGHCETMARALYEQRVFDWLDDTLPPAG